MDDLVAFLNARLDEDEAAANEVHRPRDCGSVDRDGDFYPDPVYCSCDYPARVLREVEATRQIIALFLYVAEETARTRHGADVMRLDALTSVLRQRASVYCDHPDYRQITRLEPEVLAP